MIETERHGGSRPLDAPRPLTAGHFTAGLDTPALRNVALDGFVVAQTITFTVRDKSWGTVYPTEWSTTIQHEDGQLHAELAGRYSSQDIDLRVNVTIRSLADGSLTYAIEAAALRDFERARIGICVMHPLALSGRALHVTTPDRTYSTVFPVEVSADRSITNLLGLRHTTDGVREVVFEFSGDLFEFEDQRNWGDASYKTFSTPLTLPWPMSIAKGEVIEQQVRVSALGERPRLRSASTAHSDVARAHVDLQGKTHPIPSIGSHTGTDPNSLMTAKALGIPHVRITLDAGSETAADELLAVGRSLAGSNVGVELELVADDPTDVPDLGSAIAELGNRVRWVFVFDRETQITPKGYTASIDELRATIGPRVGGGSGSNFARVNFNIQDIDFEALDALTFPISPQEHYTDHFSLIANLDAQGVLAEEGRRIAANRPISIGPITLLPRRAGLPMAADPRSRSLLAAAWTVASLSQLLASGADAITFHQLHGPAGIISDDGAITPSYHLLADLAACKYARLLPVHVTSPGFGVVMIALRCPSDAMVVVANLEAESIELDLPALVPDSRVRILDETTVDLARSDRARFTASSVPLTDERLRMLPFAVATLHVTLDNGIPVSQT